MASNRAPGVRVKEIDLSEVVVPAGTNVGATIGRTPIGPTNRRVATVSDKDFTAKFGTPVKGTANEWPMYSALEYLKASDFLWFVRPATNNDWVGGLQFGTSVPGSIPASPSATPESWECANGAVWQVQKAEAPDGGLFTEPDYADGNKPNKYYPAEQLDDQMISITALGASDVSDRLGIIIVTEANTETKGLEYTYGYTWEGKYPEKNNAQQSVHYYRINVYLKGEDQTAHEAGWFDEDPLKNLTPVESWVVTNDPTAKDASGASMYVKDVVNGYSDYIYVNTNGQGFNYEDTADAPRFYGVAETETETESDPLIASATEDNSKLVFPLIKGVYEPAPTDTGITACWNALFASKEQVTPNILIAPYASNGDTDTVANIATARRDCFAVVPVDGNMNNLKPENVVRDLRSSLRNSYVGMYLGADLVFDQYTNRNIYLPKVIFAARIIANNDNVANVWDAPAGINRGAMGTLDQLRVYTEAEIGYLYNYGVNTSKRVRGAGDFMWGQKTGQVKASALDRINVRRLLLYIENTLEPQLQAYLFEPNTEMLRSRVKSGIDQFIETIYAGGGVYAWNCVCDSTNNTPYTIDNNELNIDLYVQPVKTVEFINLNIIVTRTGVSFTES